MSEQVYMKALLKKGMGDQKHRLYLCSKESGAERYIADAFGTARVDEEPEDYHMVTFFYGHDIIAFWHVDVIQWENRTQPTGLELDKQGE
ncbi:MAG: hypothetical protein JRD89_21005 [Deltaproteobacteria bacterium]|nr:hypothetical protein [Deltaproteobacteria bacterium]